ncbi:MAG: transporter substrate-binding domain-containing protein [Ruminococcaceae bacterium]|nr:transporter substrate-binding domain-containing protein [Oscillospiraceae bacterium]
MKKIISLVLVAVMLVFCLASCAKKNSDFVATDATDLIQEDFGIAVQKGNATLLAEVNKVVDAWVKDGTMTKYVDYYTALSDFEAGAEGATKPDAGDLKLTWDFGAATETITVYTESGFAPFEFISNGNVIGVDIAIMSEVALNMGKKLDVQDVAFDTIPTCVQQATGDAVGAAGMTITDERKETVDFSNIYYSSTIVVVSAKDKPISTVKDLTGLKVAVQEGTSGDIIISKATTTDGYKYITENDAGEEEEVTIKCGEGTEVVRYKQYALALEDLKAGRVDAILMDKLPAQTMLAVAN